MIILLLLRNCVLCLHHVRYTVTFHTILFSRTKVDGIIVIKVSLTASLGEMKKVSQENVERKLRCGTDRRKIFIFDGYLIIFLLL